MSYLPSKTRPGQATFATHSFFDIFLPIQLESVAKTSNLQYIEVLQSYGNPIY